MKAARAPHHPKNSTSLPLTFPAQCDSSSVKNSAERTFKSSNFFDGLQFSNSTSLEFNTLNN